MDSTRIVRRYVAAMTAQDVRDLPAEEKLRIMAAIWDDMRERFEDAAISRRTIAFLDERKARVARGEARLHEWDEVKNVIGRG